MVKVLLVVGGADGADGGSVFIMALSCYYISRC